MCQHVSKGKNLLIPMEYETLKWVPSPIQYKERGSIIY